MCGVRAQPRPWRWRGVGAHGTQEQAVGAAPGHEGGEVLEQVAQRMSGCPIPVNILGQVGWGFDQSGLVSAAPQCSAKPFNHSPVIPRKW